MATRKKNSNIKNSCFLKRKLSRKKELTKHNKNNNKCHQNGNINKNPKKKSRDALSHSYYIVNCKYNELFDLDDTVLERHLKSLGLIPDTNIKVFFDHEYKRIRHEKGLTLEKFCEHRGDGIKFKKPDIKVVADVFFYHLNTNFLNKPFYNYNKFLCNVINLNYYELDKILLYSNILKYNAKKEITKKNFIKTISLNEALNGSKSYFKKDKHYILRPLHGFGGSGIFYIHGPSYLDNAIRHYKTEKDFKGHKYKYDEIAVSEIITDLLLFKGLKFHLRMYYMVAILENEISCFLLETGKIVTAKKIYNLVIPFSKNVHDTHLKSTDNDYIFPTHLTPENYSQSNYSKNTNKTINNNNNINDIILRGIRDIARGLSNVVVGLSKKKPKSLLYDDQKNGYYIYGLDILVKNNLEPVLIECNIQPSFKCHTTENMKELSELVFGWVHDTILEPLFKYPGTATIHARKHPTYIPLNI